MGRPYKRFKMAENESKKKQHFKKNNYQKFRKNQNQTGEKPGEASKKKEKKIVYLPKPGKLQWTEKALIVCFDLELAFGNEASEIYQIGAMATENDKILINILPEGNIHWGVVKYAGTYVSTEIYRTTNTKYLWHSKQKQILPSVSPVEGIFFIFVFFQFYILAL